MNQNYSQLTRTIEQRLNSGSIRLNESLQRELSAVGASDVLVFIRTAMMAVPEIYTKVSLQAGGQAKEDLGYLPDTSFQYQGSVMTNTHIRDVSDIDLLVISEKFYSRDLIGMGRILESREMSSRFQASSLQKMQSESSLPVYKGSSITDLKLLRLTCENRLLVTNDKCDVDKPKCISIENTELDRNVDVVISNWYDDIKSIINNKGEYRGIQVYNKEAEGVGLPDYPFLSIARINKRGEETRGRLKKMVRFLKNLKANSNGSIRLSSFDINAICYDIKVSEYQSKKFHELVGVLYRQLNSLAKNKEFSDELTSVDDREYIFKYNPEKLENLKTLLVELSKVFFDMPAPSLIPDSIYIG